MSCSKVCPILVAALLLFSGHFLYVNLFKAGPVEKQPETEEVLAFIPDTIFVNAPLQGSVISSPLKFSGSARGYWFFEATAPVVITDWDGLIIGEGYMTATEPWMTEEVIPFEGLIEFTKPEYKNTGTIIFKNANASGLPEHDRALEFPILFE